ncbi:MAG TPA: hypothetical protein VGL56_20550 [Fimbriimonadaceae bacterium]|jgi:hypothetical protein
METEIATKRIDTTTDAFESSMLSEEYYWPARQPSQNLLARVGLDSAFTTMLPAPLLRDVLCEAVRAEVISEGRRLYLAVHWAVLRSEDFLQKIDCELWRIWGEQNPLEELYPELGGCEPNEERAPAEIKLRYEELQKASEARLQAIEAAEFVRLAPDYAALRPYHHVLEGMIGGVCKDMDELRLEEYARQLTARRTA